MAKRMGITCLLAAAAAGLAAIGCNDNGYRTNVYPGAEGNYTVQRVPEESPPPQSGSSANAPAISDKDLAQIVALWPQLSPDDRKTVSDLVRRLANQTQ